MNPSSLQYAVLALQSGSRCSISQFQLQREGAHLLVNPTERSPGRCGCGEAEPCGLRLRLRPAACRWGHRRSGATRRAPRYALPHTPLSCQHQ
jgi:hypothetical protein